jgi:hypothetical protein
MQKIKISPLKIISIVIGLAGMVVANELQRRETEEIVTDKLNLKLDELTQLVDSANAQPEHKIQELEN